VAVADVRDRAGWLPVHSWRFSGAHDRRRRLRRAGWDASSSLFYTIGAGSCGPVAYNVVLFICVLPFSFADRAMAFDMTDPDGGHGEKTDIAFLLHLLAAPLIFHSVPPGTMTEVTNLDPRHGRCNHKPVSWRVSFVAVFWIETDRAMLLSRSFPTPAWLLLGVDRIRQAVFPYATPLHAVWRSERLSCC